MKSFRVTLTQTVLVTVEETKFTKKFLADYRKMFYKFTTIEEHARHIGQLYMRGLFSEDFVEGYGDRKEIGKLGIVIEEEDMDNVDIEPLQ